MNKSITLITLISGLLISCASVHSGKIGSSSNKASTLPAKISAVALESSPKNDNFQLIQVTIENTSEDWLRIEKIRAILPNPADSKVSAVMGQDLVNWAEAQKAQGAVNEYNNSLAQATLMGAGLLASFSGNSAVATAGDVALLGGVGWATTSGIKNDLKTAEGVVKVPENHLYAPVAVPAKMFQRRWILLNKPPTSYFATLVIEVQTVEGLKETYELPL